MSLPEAIRQFQATIEARRAALPWATDTEVLEMDEHVQEAQKVLDAAWLRHTVRND